MQPALLHEPIQAFDVRPARPADLSALAGLENAAFATDRISPRGFRRFLTSPNAALIVCETGGDVVGYALVLFRTKSPIARLYSIAVAAAIAGRGIGAALLLAAEAAAQERGSFQMRLEVQEKNARAISRYRKSGYSEFGRRARYYDDGGNALRFDKRLTPALRGLQNPPPYFHQTTEFTCGPACMTMALAWADPSLRPSPALEFKLWREATTIFMTSGPGGCEPYGIAVALRRRGLFPEIHVNDGGPYFLDTARSADKRRVMQVTQEDFAREARTLGIPIHLAPLDESSLMKAFDGGAVAIVLVSGYRMLRRNVPHWLFAFGHERGHVLVHDPAAKRNADGTASGPETYALPWSMFSAMTRFGRGNLRAALLIRKGPSQ